jgi:hypothetical protein
LMQSYQVKVLMRIKARMFQKLKNSETISKVT